MFSLDRGGPAVHDRRNREVVMTKTQRRLLITLGVLVVLELGARIPLPALRYDTLGEALPFGMRHKVSILSLGLLPYLSAAGFMMLLSGLVAPLRRLREGDEVLNQRFNRFILAFTTLLALLQGFGVAQVWTSDGIVASHFLLTSPWLFRVLTAVAMAVGTLLTVSLAQLVTRHGLGNGVALIILVGLGRDLFRWLRVELATPLLPEPRSPSWTLFVLVAVALVAVLAAWLRARHPLILQDEKSELVVDVPLRPNLTGAMPLAASATIVGMLGMIPALGPYVWYPAAPWWSWAIRLLLVAGINLLFTAWLTNPVDLRLRAARWGFRLAGQGSEAWFDGTLLRMFWPHTLILWLVLLSQPVVLMIVNVRPEVGQFFGAALLINVALAMEFWRVMRPRFERDRGETVCVLQSRVWLEPALAHVRLEGAGIESRVEDDRVIGLTGSRSPWEICKPRFPAFFNYPYLGGGRVCMLVAPESREAAKAELERWRGGDAP